MKSLYLSGEKNKKNISLQQIGKREDQIIHVIDYAGLGTWDYNLVTGEFVANEHFKKWFGLQNGKEVDINEITKVIKQEDKEWVAEAVQKAITFSEHFKFDITHSIIPPGSNVPMIVWSVGKVFFDDSGNALRFTGLTSDITAKTKALKQVKEREKNLRKLIKYAPVAMCIFNGSNYVIGAANDKTLELWGKELKQVINKPLLKGFPEIEGQGIKELLDHVYKSGERFIANERLVELPRHNKMESFYINLLYEPVKGDDGNVSAIIGVARDVTTMVIDQKKNDREKENIRKQMLRASIAAQEKERAFISSELHDNVSQILATTKLLTERLEGVNEKEKNYILQIRENIDKSITEIRELSYGLSPALLDFAGLQNAVSDIVNKINLSGKIMLILDLSGYDKSISINKEIELAIFRIIQSQTVNILKHSGASSANINLSTGTDFIEVLISDNGKGCEIKKLKKGLGLQNIINRTELFDGTVSLKSAPGEGCTLIVKIPLEQNKKI